MFFDLYRVKIACFISIFFVAVSFSQMASAAVLSTVSVDRTSTIISGTGFLSAASGGISVSSFGPTGSVTSSNMPVFPSIIVDIAGVGSVSFTGFGFPPPVVLGGAIDDFSASVGLLEFLFVDVATNDLFVVDLVSSIISGTGLTLSAPFIDTSASISVYSATDASVSIPATGWLMVAVFLCAGRFFRRMHLA